MACLCYFAYNTLAVCCLYADESDGEDEEYATASSGDEEEGGVSSQHCVSLVTTERGKSLIIPFNA